VVVAQRGAPSAHAASPAAGAAADAGAAAARRAALCIAAASAAAMRLADALSCLGALPALNPVCFDGTRVFFWGGFGAEAPCQSVPTVGGTRWLVRPPFALPDPATNVVTMWTMTQRAGSATYHLFTAGTSGALFALALLACEAGARPPRWWAASSAARAAGALLGLRTCPVDGRVRVRWHVADVFGENALAVYLLGDPLSDHIGDMLPPDCPAWYFVLWGEGLYLSIAYVAASYLRRHRLFLRL
jgi:hypothetical protein